MRGGVNGGSRIAHHLFSLTPLLKSIDPCGNRLSTLYLLSADLAKSMACWGVFFFLKQIASPLIKHHPHLRLQDMNY